MLLNLHSRPRCGSLAEKGSLNTPCHHNRDTTNNDVVTNILSSQLLPAKATRAWREENRLEHPLGKQMSCSEKRWITLKLTWSHLTYHLPQSLQAYHWITGLSGLGIKGKKLVFVLMNRLHELRTFLVVSTIQKLVKQTITKTWQLPFKSCFTAHVTLLYRYTAQPAGSFKMCCFASRSNQVMNRTWHRTNIYILISVFALFYCLFKPAQLRLLALYAPGCIP